MRLFNKVAIVGIGLIGGSLALEIKKRKIANEVIGISRHKDTLLFAKKIKAIDKGSQDLKIIKDADLVILATPVNAILKLAQPISRIIKKDCLITDTGSTKQQIVNKLEKLFPNYIGSHPLAGSEKRGIINASIRLFENSLCILTPTDDTKPYVRNKIKKLWNMVGAKVILLSPGVHDKILSFVSHLPHIIAFSLINSIPCKYLKFASSGLKDTTRIAASDAQLWMDIFLSNQKNMLQAINQFQRRLLQIKTAIKERNSNALAVIIKRAKCIRDSL